MPSDRLTFARELRQRATTAEERLWQALRGRRLAGSRWKRQVPIAGYVADFLCPAARLIVELDGRQHAWESEYDALRTRDLEALGHAVMRFTNAAVADDLDAVLARIAAALRP